MDTVESVVSLAKRRGFVFASGEIYGGTRSAWDYGPLGVELKDNVRRQWWKSMVQTRDDVVGLDSAVILPRETWEASGHVETFTDPLIECTSCHKRFREDTLIEEYAARKGKETASLTEVPCPNCGVRGQYTEPRQFSGLLKTYLGPVESEEGLHYLRPETAQGIFLNFLNIMNVVAQEAARSASRRSASPSATRSRRATSSSAPASSSRWRWSSSSSRAPTRSGTTTGCRPAGTGTSTSGSTPRTSGSSSTPRRSSATTPSAPSTSNTDSASVPPSSPSSRVSPTAPTSTSRRTPQRSGADLTYFDQDKGERWTPYVIEPAAGLTRATLAFLLDAYAEDEAPNTKGGVDKRTVLRFDPRLAPVKVAVLPLSRNEDLSPKARDLAAALRQRWTVEFDDAQAIGRRYRRQDEIGTPYCVTVDFETLDDEAVTIRERDSMSQERVPIEGVERWLLERLPAC